MKMLLKVVIAPPWPPLGSAPDFKAPELTEIARHLKGLNVKLYMIYLWLKTCGGHDADTRMSLCVCARAAAVR